MIEVRNLSKRFGKRVALDDVSFDVAAGEIFAVIGERGSGKTTLMRIMASLLEPSSGDLAIGGVSVVSHPQEIRPYIGYLPDDFGVYADMSVVEYLAFFAECYAIPKAARATLITDLLQLVDLTRRQDQQVDTLSHGMKQRLGIARMLVNDPAVLLLDEPTLGMDPRAHVETRELIRELASLEKTIVVTARSLSEMKDLASGAAMLAKGRLVATGSVAELVASQPVRRVIAIRFLGDAGRALDIIRECPGVVDVELGTQGPPAGPPPTEPSAVPPNLDPAQVVAISQLAAPSNVQSLMKDVRCGFDGSYDQANAVLSHLLRGGVQVVAFGEA